MKKVYILASLLLMGQSSWAQIRDFQTARLKSTAGAGVASVLSTEASILNPATAAFFQKSGFSYQQYDTTLQRKSTERKNAGDDFPSRNVSRGYFISDNSGHAKGGFAYIQQKENNFSRERMTLNSAAPIGPKHAIGISYSYIQDKGPKESSPRHQTHHQLNVGTSYIVDKDTILGLAAHDITRTTPNEERVLAGFQYNITDRFVLIGDVGARHTKSISQNYLWRAALQINIFSDFFFRAGRFHDNIKKLKGTGWGASWVGPRFGVEFAQQFSEQFTRDGYIYKNEQLMDTTLAAIIKF